MENKKNNYKKPDMQVVEIQYQGHLLDKSPDPQGPGSSESRENRNNWSSED